MGSRAGTVQVTSPSAFTTGTSVVNVDGLTGATDTIKKGEVFTIGSVYDVNAETKQTSPTSSSSW
jgi:hypothetical protein